MMEPGYEMDAVIEQTLFGGADLESASRAFSTEEEYAWEVLREMWERGWSFDVERNQDDGQIEVEFKDRNRHSDWLHWANWPTMAGAVCICALRACGFEVDDE